MTLFRKHECRNTSTHLSRQETESQSVQILDLMSSNANSIIRKQTELTHHDIHILLLQETFLKSNNKFTELIVTVGSATSY